MLTTSEWTTASELYVLRLIEANGPLSGGEVAHHLRPLALAARQSQPVFPLLHRLTDAGWLAADEAQLPKRYTVTEAGQAGAVRLVEASTPQMSAYFQRLISTAETVLGDRTAR